MHLDGVALDLGGGLRLVPAGMGHAWLWLAAGILALTLLGSLYRFERRLVSRRLGLGLLALRALAALTLVAALFEPIAERTRTERIRGRVLLGVDLSESMATVDRERPKAEVEALHTLLDLSPSLDAATLSRREVVRRLLARPWLERLGRDHAIEALGFARGLVEGSIESLAAALVEPTQPIPLDLLTTDWEPILERASRDTPDAAPVLGVVLLTDGHRNGPTRSPSAADGLVRAGIPVYPVLVGGSGRPRDAAVASISAPETIDVGQTARIVVTVKADGLPPGTAVPVTLERAGAAPLRQAVSAQPDGGRPTVAFTVPLETAGRVEMTVSVGPIGDDARPDNDSRPVTVVVTDDTARVLAIDGEARWEFQYLRNALVRDARVEFSEVVIRQPSGPGGTAYPTALPDQPKPDLDSRTATPADPLGDFDAIILGDVGPDDLDAEAWSRLDRYVAERGGTLVLAAGPAGWPSNLQALEPLRDLLPVQDVRLVPIDEVAIDPARPALAPGVAIVPTTEAETGMWPMFQFAEDAARSRAVWAGLPRQPWGLAGTAKPTATPLAIAVPPGVDALEQAASSVAMAAMPYGLGKVLWIGTDGTWRWRYRLGDLYHHRFWGQIVQWSTSGRLAAGNRLVQFGPLPPRVSEGEATLFRARFTEQAPEVSPDLLVAARIFRVRRDEHGVGSPASGSPPDVAPGEPVAIVPLRPAADRPRVFESSAPVLPPGEYVARLDAPALDEVMAAEGGMPEAGLTVLVRETSELVELAADREAVEALAAATGGRVLADVEINAVPELFTARSLTRQRIESVRLGDRPEMLLAFFGLLTAEWALRKRAGLP